MESGGFLGRLLRPLLKTGLLLMKNVLKLLAKSNSIPVGLTQQRQQQMQLLKRNKKSIIGTKS